MMLQRVTKSLPVWTILLIGFLIAVGCWWFIGQSNAWAHGDAPSYEELWSGEARLFVADNARDEILVIDLPDGQVTARIQVPPKTMGIGATPDGNYVVVTRGRDVDRQHVTVINTAITKEGFRRPFISKTLLLGKSIGGIHGGHLSMLWGKLFLVAEAEGKMYRFDSTALDGNAPFAATEFDLGIPDHYDFAEAADSVWAGGIRSEIRLLDKQGKELVKVSCPVNHGIVVEPKTKRVFGACAKDVVVIEGQSLQKRIPYPGKERIGAFTITKAGFFGTSESVQNLQLIDPTNLTIKLVPLDSILYARGTTPNGELMLVLLQNGMFQIRDGVDGKLLREVRVSTPFPEWEEDISGAIMPSIVATNDLAYISIPQRGTIAEVDLEAGKLMRYLMIGGKPTRLVLLEAAD